MGENKEYISHFEEKGNINIAEEVIAALAAGAAVEADGVTGLAVSPGKEVTDIIGKRTVKGVKVQLEDEQLVIDVCVLAVLGKPVQYKQRERWMTGRAVDLREDGCLMVEGIGGVAALRGGEIRMEGEWQ